MLRNKKNGVGQKRKTLERENIHIKAKNKKNVSIRKEEGCKEINKKNCKKKRNFYFIILLV